MGWGTLEPSEAEAAKAKEAKKAEAAEKKDAKKAEAAEKKDAKKLVAPGNKLKEGMEMKSRLFQYKVKIPTKANKPIAKR